MTDDTGAGDGSPPASPVLPVTAEEVDQMFREASQRGPWPAIESCGYMAEVINGQLETRECWASPPDKIKRRRDSMQFLRGIIAETRADMTGDWGWEVTARFYQQEAKALDDLETALDAAEGLLCGLRLPRPKRPWHPAAFIVAQVALTVLQEDCNSRAKGVHRNGIAAHFTELALERMGFKGVGREAIASLWAKWDRPTQK